MIDLHVARTPNAGSISSAELVGLSTAELTELRHTVAAGSRADKSIVAELYLRTYVQAAVDAKAAVIIDEERRLACGER